MGERFPLPGGTGAVRYNYGLVMSIFMGCVFGYVILLTFLGPEKLGRDMSESTTADAFEQRGKGGDGDWEDEKKATVEEGEEEGKGISNV